MFQNLFFNNVPQSGLKTLDHGRIQGKKEKAKRLYRVVKQYEVFLIVCLNSWKK